jgi:hypothetical protein
MKRGALIIIWVCGLLVATAAGAQKGYTFKSAEYNFLIRNSAALSNDIAVQLTSDFALNTRWLNLSPGLEVSISEGHLTRYFLEDRIEINDKNSVVVRLNHLDYPAWNVGQNFLNLYYLNTLKHFSWGLGVVWTATNLSDYRNPVKFNTDFDQFRLLYTVAYDIPFKKKWDFKIGAEDFTQFENYTYDNVGPYIELGWQATNRTRVKVKGEFRLAGIDTGTPSLERQTYLIGLEWKNVPKKEKKAKGY